jgi:ferredoxin-NADP reductase
MTEATDGTGEQGRIDEAMLRRHLSDVERPIYYAAGPPKMVRDMATMLREAGVAKKHIVTEEFDGY